MASVAVLNPPPMYRIRPFFEIKKVKLPDCMYMMRPVHKLPGLIPTEETTGAALSYLEERQGWVLSQITSLQGRVKALGDRLGVGPDDIGILPQTSGAIGGHGYQDVVVSCPPCAAPYALLPLYQYIARHTPVTCKVHVHSSASAMATGEMRNFMGRCGVSSQQHSGPAQLKITLVWKSDSVCSVPTMVVSPHNQTPVEGIANISRYISREFCPDLYESLDAAVASQIDGWLDLLCVSLACGSSKEKSSVMRRLNAQLGSSPFLVGGTLTLADVVAYAVLCNTDAGLKLSANVKQWLKRLQSVPELSCLPCSWLPDCTS